jgi:hypothetical protein
VLPSICELQEETKQGEQNILKALTRQKHRLACNPDSGAAVVLSAPRSAFLPYLQPAGASNSLQGEGSKRQDFDGHGKWGFWA